MGADEDESCCGVIFEGLRWSDECIGVGGGADVGCGYEGVVGEARKSRSSSQESGRDSGVLGPVFDMERWASGVERSDMRRSVTVRVRGIGRGIVDLWFWKKHARPWSIPHAGLCRNETISCKLRSEDWNEPIHYSVNRSCSWTSGRLKRIVCLRACSNTMLKDHCMVYGRRERCGVGLRGCHRDYSFPTPLVPMTPLVAQEPDDRFALQLLRVSSYGSLDT